MADSDRYGLTAYYAFEVQNNAFATMDKVERGLHNIESAIKNLEKTGGSALGQKLNSTFGAASGHVQDLANEVKKTNNVLASTSNHLNPIKQEFRALRAESRNIDFGDLKNPAVFDKAKKSVNSYIAELDKLEAQIQGTSAAERQFKSEIVRAKQVAHNKVDISEQQRSGANATERAGMATGVATAGAAIAMPLAMIGKKSIDTYTGFEDQLFAVEAVMDATQKTQANLDKVRDKSKQLGAATKFSAGEAAGGFVLLAQAGYSVDQQLSAIDGTLKLAAAGSMGLAEATGYTLNSIGQFGLKAADSSHVADVMAKTANSAQLDVKDLGESLKYAGVNAKTYGSSIEQTSAMIGVLSEAGLKGSEAGTVMRAVFTRLSAPTAAAKSALEQLGVSVLDSSGKMRPVNQVLKDIHGGLGQLNDGQKADAMKAIFGTEAIGGAQYLINNTGKINAYTQANYNASQGMGAAAEAALTLEKGLGGSFRNLSSAWEGVLIEIGQVLAPIVKIAADALSKLMTAFIGLPQPMKTGIVLAGVLVLGLASLAVVVGTAAIAYFTLQQAMATTGIASTLLKNGMIPLTGVTQKIALAFGTQGFAGVISAAGATLSTLGATVGTFATGALAFITSPIGLAIAGFLALYAVLELLTPSVNVLGVILSVLAAPIGLVVGLLKGLVVGFINAFKPIFSMLQPVAGQFNLVGDAIKQASGSFALFAGAGEKIGKVLGFVLANLIIVPLYGIIAVVKLLIGGLKAIGTVIDFAIIKPMQFVFSIASAIASPFIAAAVQIKSAWQGFVTWFLSMPLVQFAVSLGQGLINALNHSPTVKIPIAWEGAIGRIQGLMNFLVSVAQGVGSLLTGIFVSPFQAVISAVQNTISMMGGMWQGFATWLTELLTAVPKGIGSAFEKLIPPFLRDNNGGDGGKKSPVRTALKSASKAVDKTVPPLPRSSRYPQGVANPPVQIPLQTPISSANKTVNPQTSKLTNPQTDVRPFTRPNIIPGIRPAVVPVAATAVSSQPVPSTQSQVKVPVRANVQLQTTPVFQSVIQDVTNQIPQAQMAVAQGVTQIEQAYNVRASQARFVGLSWLLNLDLSPIKQQFTTLTQQTVEFAKGSAVAIATLDFGKAQTGLKGYIGNLVSAIANISSHIGGMSLSIVAFGIASLASLSPVILIMGSVIIIAVAISRNFLGLRTILKGVFQVISGVVQGFRRSLSGIIQIIQGIGRIFSGVSLAVRGDFSVMGEGIHLVFSGIRNVASGVSHAIKQTFQGTAQILRGVFQGIEQVFSGVGSSIRAVLRMLRGDFGRVGDGARSAFNLARTVSHSVFKGMQAIGSSVIHSLGKLFSGVKLHLNLESLHQSISTINQLFEKVKSFVMGGIRAIASLPISLNLTKLSRLPNVITGITTRARELMQGFTEHISSLPIHLKTAVFEQLPGLITGTLEKVSHGWLSFTQRLDEIPVLSEFKTFIHAIPSLFTAAVEKVQAIWHGLTNSVGGFLDRITGKSKKSGKELVSNLAENSPGPTFQIRQKWKALAIALTGQMENLSAHAQTTGGKISGSLGKVKFSESLRNGLNKVGGGFSSLGSVVSNFSPQLAAPLFIAGDLISSFDSLAESVPAAKKMFTEFAPKLAGLGDAAKKGIAPLKGVGMSMFTGLQGLSGQLIPKLTMMASTVFPMIATAASAAWTTVIAPLLPFIAGIALAVGAIALLTYAFRHNFLGIRTLVEGIGSVLSFTLLMPFRIIEGIISLISSGLRFMVGAIAGAGAAVRDTLLAPFTQLSQIGNKVGRFFGHKPAEPAPKSIASSLEPVKSSLPESTKSHAVTQIKPNLSNSALPAQSRSQSQVNLVPAPLSAVLPVGFQAAPVLPQSPIQTSAQAQTVSPQSIPEIGNSKNQLIPGLVNQAKAPQSTQNAIAPSVAPSTHQPVNQVTSQPSVQAISQPLTQAISQDTSPAQAQWQSFSDWFKGMLSGMVQGGEQAGKGLINALNHSPTVKIPIAWEGAVSSIGGFLGGLIDRGVGAGKLLSIAMSGMAAIAGQTVGKAFNHLTLAAASFGLSSLLALAPVVLALAGVGLAIFLVSKNFLGLKTIFSGVAQIVRGVISGIIQAISGLINTVKGIGNIIAGIFTGNLGRIGTGFNQVFGGAGQIVGAIASTITSTLGGSVQIVTGLLQGLKQIFSGFGRIVGSAFSAPRAMLEGFIGIIAQIEAKVKGVGAAIASSPIGKLAQAVGIKAQGKTATIPEAQQLVGFDQELKQSETRALPDTRKGSPVSVSQSVNSIPQPLSTTVQSISSINSPNQKASTQASPNRFQRLFGRKSTAVVESAIAPPQPINAQPAPGQTAIQVPVQSGISQAPKTQNDAPAQALTTGQKATQSLSDATDAAGSLASILSTIAPGLAAPINGFATLASGVMGLVATLPMMIASFASLDLSTLTWGSITSSVSGFVSASFASVTATASSMWAGLIATYTTAGGISGIWAAITSTASGIVSTGFASVTATASSMWTSLIATYATAGGISGIWALITSTASGIVSSGFAATTAIASGMGINLSAVFGGLSVFSGIWATVTATASGIVSSGFGAVTAIASGMGINLSAVFGGLSVFTTVWGAVSTAVSGIVGTAFAGVATAASSMWLAVTGPLAPFILAFLAAAAIVFVAYQTNFLGIRQIVDGVFGFIGSVLGGIWSVISGTVRAIASIIGSILMQPIQAIGAAFSDIGSAFGGLFNSFITPFQPIFQAVQSFFAMFNDNTNKSAGALDVIKIALEIAFLPLRIVFAVISTAIRIVGLAIAGIIQIVSVLVSVLMIPIRILGVFISIFQAIGGVIYAALVQPILAFVGLIQGVISFFMNLPGLVANAISAPFRAIQSFIQGIGQAIAGIPILGSIFTAISGVKAQPQGQQNQTPVQRFAAGGPVKGSGGTDSQNALVTPGEFILNPIASKMFRPILEGMNNGATSLMQLIPQLPPIPFPIPVPVPVGANSSGSLPPISLQLNFGDIVIGQGGDRSTQDSMSLVSEFMDKIAPLLERQVVDILRATLEKAR